LGSAAEPSLWLGRISRRIGLSYTAGVILIGTLPPVVGSIVGTYLTGSFSPQLVVNVANLGAFSLVPPLCLFGASYILRRVKALGEYSKTLGSGIGFEEHLERLASLRFLGIVYTVLCIFILSLGAASGGIVLAGGPLSVLVVALTALYIVLIIATLVWTFSYSMHVVHQLGSQEMLLLSFAQDRTLGLRPFGLTAFQLTVVYIGSLIVLMIHINIPPLPIQFNLAFLSFFFIAIPLFLLPLITVHRQLVRAKARELEWIGRRYAAIISAIKTVGDGQLDERLKSDLAATRQLKEDVQQVHDWPFDTGILARLIAIILSISVILLSGYIRDILKF
jgi:hypothetical protein